MSTKIYIAALYSSRDYVREWVAPGLIDAGFEVTARWLYDGVTEKGDEQRRAVYDLVDVHRSDALLLLTLPYGTSYVGGGRTWEAGYAMGLGKPVIVLGDREIIFCHHPNVVVCDTMEQVIHHLRTFPPVSRPRQMLDWCHRTFGDIALNRVERAVRLLEEAMELAQCVGVGPGMVGKVADRVFHRPAGNLPQEVGQVQNLLECFAESTGLDAAEEGRREFVRCLVVPQKEWDRRHAAKVEQGVVSNE